jgi:Peptidase M15
MASDLATLKRKRKDAQRRNAAVEKALAGERKDLRHIQDELKEEREHRDELKDRRDELKKELKEEIAADERGRGKRPEEWEEWAADRREELADEIDASIARIQRLLERGVKTDKERDELVKRDRKLEAELNGLRKRIERKKDPGGNLTKDFSVAEFDCNNGTPCPSGIVPHLKQLCVAHLQPLRDSGGTVGINSGYRTVSYNAAIGGEPNSYHVYTYRMKAPAVDHVQVGRSASAVANWHDSHDRFDGMGRYSSFVHGDDRGYVSRWYG